MRRSLVPLSVAVLIAAGVAVASRAQAPAQPTPDAAADPVPKLLQQPDDLARGKALFTGTCGAYCHQANPQAGAAGGADAPFLFGCEFKHGGGDAELFATISHGVPGTRMVPFTGAIPDEDIWRIVAYLKSATTCKPAP